MERFLTVFHEPHALPSDRNADGSFARGLVLMDRWRRFLGSLPCRAVVTDLVLMESILPRLVVSAGDAADESPIFIRVDEPPTQRPLMEQVHVEPLMQPLMQQGHVNADSAPRIWNPDVQQWLPGLAAIHEHQQARDDEVWISW